MVWQFSLRNFSIILQNSHKFSVSGCKSVSTNLQTFTLSWFPLSNSKNFSKSYIFLHGMDLKN